MAFPWRPTQLLLSLTYFKTGILILNTVISSTYSLDSCLYSIIFSHFWPFGQIIFTSNSFNYNKQSSWKMRKKNGKHRFIKRSKLSLWKTHLEYWGRVSIPTTSTRFLTRSLCCRSGCKIGILYQRSSLGKSRATGNLKFPRQLHGAPRDFSLPLAGGGTNFSGPRRTKSSQNNWHKFDAPLSHDIWNSNPWPWCCFFPRGATMIRSRTGILCSATAQDNSIQTSTQITHKHALHKLSLQGSPEHTQNVAWCYRRWPQTHWALSLQNPKGISSVWSARSKLNPAHRAGHHAVLCVWWRTDQGS